MTEAERRDRASHRCKPHLDTALRLIDQGDTRAEAGGGGGGGGQISGVPGRLDPCPLI